MSRRTVSAGLLAAALVAAILTPTATRATPAPASAQTSAASAAAGGFTAVTPSRLLDTRTGTGAAKAPVAPRATLTLQVTGRSGVPSTGVAAAEVNVTVTGSTHGGNVVVYPAGAAKPPTSDVSFAPGQTIAGLVLAKLGTSGRIEITNNSSGTVNVIADVSGYFAGGTAASTGTSVPLTPYRALDTRNGTGGVPTASVAAHAVLTFTVGIGGTGRVPATGVSAVALNVTVTGATVGGNLAVHPTADSSTSNINFAAGQTIANLVVAEVDSSGHVSLINNSAGTVNVVADVEGYFLAGLPIQAGAFGIFHPDRILDTRYGPFQDGDGPLPAHSTTVVSVGRGEEMPASGASAAVLNITATRGGAAGNLTAFTTGTTRPATSNLNFAAGQTVANLAIVKLGPSEQVSIINNSSASVHIIVDITGYVLGTTLPVPPTSPSYYVRSLTGNTAHDVAAMTARGRLDGAAVAATDTAPRIVILDFGAESRTDPNGPGHVTLPGTHPGVIISDADVVKAVHAYISGWASATSSSARVTVAVGTNNDGPWTSASTEASDWWTDVVAPSSAGVPSTFTVVGGADFEPGFAADQDAVTGWVEEYAVTLAQPLIQFGTADGCPADPGAFDGECAPVPVDGGPTTHAWEQDAFFQEVHDIAPTKVSVLPQVYNPSQAVQWQNISLSNELFGSGPITFIGSSTGVALDAAQGTSNSQSVSQGWASLYRAVATYTPPHLAYATDFGVL